MKGVPSIVIVVVCLSAVATSAVAQSLTEQLNAESPAVLAAAARMEGDAARGAILFPQQKLGCVNCHAVGNDDLLGPDLTRLGSEATDVYLVEALLQPSKVIRKDFATVTVLTGAGKSIAGRVLQQNDEQLVLRESIGERRRLSLAKSDIDEIVPSRTSGMPDNLVDQLKDRQEFLDLVRYTMEIAASGSAADSGTVRSLGGGVIREELEGIVLLSDFNCAACHQQDDVNAPVAAKRAPDLDWSSGRIDPHFIERFIADPLHVKPGTTMPDVMTQLSVDERRRAANEITHYVVSLSDRTFATQPVDPEAAERGHELFHSVGCVACHSPRDDAGQDLLPNDSIPLGTPELKYSVNTLVAFLENPHAVRASGRMPNMQLTHWEAVDIASYLMRRPTDTHSDAQPFALNAVLAEQGKARFLSLGCAQCHGKPEPTHARMSLPLANVRADRGCLSETPGASPRFSITDMQRNAIRSALARQSAPLSDEDQIALTLTAFKCVNCHQRDELGGVAPERNPHFQTTNPNLGPQGRVPPTLTGVGAKLNPTWMRQVLVSGRAIRPYMKTRMPQYGTENVAHLVDLLQQTDHLPDIEFAEFSDEKEMRTAGFEMAGTGGLNCIACHTFQLKPAATMPAVDLTDMAERLQKSWFYHYMKDPQRLSMNTVMPTFWPGGHALRKDILDGDSDLQIEALWQYLLDGRQARAPKGLIYEPMELLATDEAVMLRRSYPGIGKRGIGVGYPNQVNLVFDAEQMRLAMLWKGRFADPGGVWRSQGHGTVRPLARQQIRFAAGPDLDDATSPWTVDDDRPPRHHFRGYVLDAKQRPAFMYQFDGVQVEDYLVDLVDPESGEPFLRRTLTLQSERGRPNTDFRAATGEKIVSDGDTFLIDDALRVRIDANHTAQIVDTPTGKQLRIPMEVARGSSTLVLEYAQE